MKRTGKWRRALKKEARAMTPKKKKNKKETSIVESVRMRKIEKKKEGK